MTGTPDDPPDLRGDAADVWVVLVAHGSRSAEANQAHRDLADALADRSGWPTMAAFLELADPSIGAAIAEVASRGAKRAVVVPYFLHPGRHQSEDIPRLVSEAALLHPGLAVVMGDAFGADPEVVTLLVGQVERALGGPSAVDG